MKKIDKKGTFDIINAGMLSFITFVLVALLAVVLISTTQETNIVCKGTWSEGACYECRTGFDFVNTTACCNSTAATCVGTANKSDPYSYTGSAYNASLDMMNAGLIAPQFSQIIVIVIIVVGILSALAVLGYGVYQRMK